MIPYFSRNIRTVSTERGSIANNTFDPSSGGMGTMLNTASMTLINTTETHTESSGSGNGANRTNSENTVAIKRFENGPAAPTNAGPNRGYFKL